MPKEGATMDTGLGLTEFLSKAPSPEPETQEQPKAEPAPKAEAEPTPKAEPEAKAKEAPKAEEPAPKAEVKTEPVEEKPKSEPEAAKPSVDWESDSNPYKKRHQDTFKWANEQRMQNVELARQVEILNKKFDGTYDPEKDATPAPTPEQIERIARVKGRTEASARIVRNKLGEEKTNQLLAEFDQKYANNAAIQMRVLESESPVEEAVKILSEEAFIRKWGGDNPDPEKIEEAIRADAQKSIEAKIEEMVTKRIQERLSQKEKQPVTLSDARAATSNKDAPAMTPLKNLLPLG